MIISHKNKFIFVHIPKCAGTSFRKNLLKYHDDPNTFYYMGTYDGRIYDMCHLTPFELRKIFDIDFKEYYTLAVIRDPIDRFISGYFEYMRHVHEYYHESHIQVIPLIMGLTEYSISRDTRFVHIRPQTDYTHDKEGNQVITKLCHINDLDTLDVQHNEIVIHGMNSHENVKREDVKKQLKEIIYRDQRVVDKLRSLYKRDYELLFPDM
jgi:hypothetical protein